MRKLPLILIAALLFGGPSIGLLAVAVIANPAANAETTVCEPDDPGQAPPSPGDGGGGDGEPVPETTAVVFPLPSGTWTKTSDYGLRTDPFTGLPSFHIGTDYAAADGTPIHAVADGRVHTAEYGDRGGLVTIEHTIDDQPVASTYVHMWEHGIYVTEGQEVTAGEHIADVGSSGYSTGPHLHFEIWLGGPSGDHTNPETWLEEHGARSAGHHPGKPAPPEDEDDECAEETAVEAGAPEPFTGSDPDAMVDDPTTTGQITARTRHALEQTQAAFPDSHWFCWAPRPGTDSDHPRGRACDGTFGNAIGEAATGPALDLGWQVADWLVVYADDLGVDYVIWQGLIWIHARADEGWLPYDGGG